MSTLAKNLVFKRNQSKVYLQYIKQRHKYGIIIRNPSQLVPHFLQSVSGTLSLLSTPIFTLSSLRSSSRLWWSPGQVGQAFGCSHWRVHSLGSKVSWQCSGKCIAQNGVELPLKTHQIMPEERHPLRNGAAPSNWCTQSSGGWRNGKWKMGGLVGYLAYLPDA